MTHPRDRGFRLQQCVLPILLVPVVSDAPLAQLAEQVTLNHWVVGSIPTRCKPIRLAYRLDS